MFWLKIILGFIAVMLFMGGAMYLVILFMNKNRMQ